MFRDDNERVTPFDELEVLEVEESLEDLLKITNSKNFEELSCNDFRYFKSEEEAESFLTKYKKSWDKYHRHRHKHVVGLPVLLFPRHNLIEIFGGHKTYTTRDRLYGGMSKLKVGDIFNASDRKNIITLEITRISQTRDGKIQVDFALAIP